MGKLLCYDPKTASCETVFDFGCFIRGLSFIGNVAVIGKSKIRETSNDFNDLDVKENSKKAGIILFDVSVGQIIGGINYDTSVEEIYDVKILENTNNAAILTSDLEEYKDVITLPGGKFWKSDK